MGNNQICGQRQRVHRKGWCLGYIHKRGNFFCTEPNYMMYLTTISKKCSSCIQYILLCHFFEG
uniref:Uncharacterized protein n=1 Tax=Aegilops tauschii subsp. strangulata TaxID=200361 RepID=A0A452Y372_AEGTS